MDRQHLPVERTAELLADLLHAPVSTGWLCSLQLEAAGKLTGFISAVKDRLAEEPVVHADETGTRVRTAKHWVHTVTSRLLTLIAVHPKRGLAAFNDIGVLSAYAGTIVHDGYSPYDCFADASHAQCGAHLLRHLTDVGDTAAFAIWTAQMTGVLLGAKAASEAAAEAGRATVAPKTAKAIRAAYHDTLDVAFALLPAGPPPRRRHTGGWSTGQRKHGTSRCGCATTPTRFSGSSTTPASRSTTTRPRGHCEWSRSTTRCRAASTASPPPKRSPPSAPTFKPRPNTARTASTSSDNSSPPKPGCKHSAPCARSACGCTTVRARLATTPTRRRDLNAYSTSRQFFALVTGWKHLDRIQRGASMKPDVGPPQIIRRRTM
jgi:hypothetical protein